MGRPSAQAASRWRTRGATARRLGLLDGLAILCCVSVGLLTAAGPLGQLFWPADVVNLFRPYVALAAGVALLPCLLTWRPGLALTSVLLAGLNLALLALPAMAGDQLPAGGAGDLKAITFNCLSSNANVDSALAWLRASAPDVVVLEELPASWRARLDELGDILPYRSSRLETAASDTEILTRLPMSKAESYRPAQDLRTLIHATVLANGRPLQVYGLHPNTLQNPFQWRERNAALELSAQWIAQSRGSSPALALGDWNTPPWSPHFHTFLRLAGMKAADPLVWPPMTRVLATPMGVRIGSSIDHVAATAGIRVRRCETGPQLGSDHAPQICYLHLGG